MMTNLSFLPDGYGTRFFAFILVALLLVARVTMLQRERRLVSARFGFMPGRRWLPLQVTTGLTVIVLAVAAFLPLISLVSDRAVEIWNFGRSPITNLEDEFARLFSGITTQKDVDGRFFGKVLPFQGKISFGGDIVMRATSRLPSYWLSRTYSEYTSKGWIAGESRRQQVGDEALPPPQESVSRLPTSQTVEVAFETDSLFTGGNLGWVSRPAVVETLAPMSFEIDLFDSSGDESFPEEIQGLARRLRDVDLRSPVAALGQISRIIPSDMVLTGPPPASVEEFGQALNKVVVERKGPLFPDVVMWRFQEPLAEADSYVLSSLVSFATDNDLREADGRYSGFIKDHYLQVPPSLPQRVRDLAADLTRGESTPLDKALAVQDYLRGGTFEYSQDISKPPKDADGVDYFLFETQEGYSDYYASAMTVMLRTVGVAARLAAGYAPGEPTGPQSRLREIKDSDSHGWTQVYFPGHGWLDFEPTPEWPVPDRSGAEGLTDAAVDPDSGDDCVETFGPLGDRALEECSDGSIVGDQAIIEEEDMLQPVAARQEFDEAANGTSRMFAGIGIGILAALLVLWLALWSAWTRGLSRATPAEKFYTKMSRLGTVAGLGRRPHQTPIEYATTLGASIPAIASHAETTAWAFASGQYAGPPSEAQSPDGVPELEQSWRRVRSGLLGRLLKRLVLMGGTNEGARSV
jgi:transglutaminase-like putative cysteine protease